MKLVSVPLSISFGIHLLIISTLIVLNSMFVSGEKLVTIDLTVEDSVNPGSVSQDEITGPEIKKQDPVMKKTAPVTRQAEVKKKAVPPPRPAKMNEQIKQPPVEPMMAPPGPVPARQELLTGAEAPAAIPVADGQDSDNNTDRESGITNATSGQTETGSSIASAKIGSGKGSGSSGASDSEGKPEYNTQQFAYIRELVQKKAVYPKIAEQREWEGQVVVSFVIFLDGGVKDIKIVKSSGREILDKSAMEAVAIASPFPKPPAALELKMPVTYKLLYKN